MRCGSGRLRKGRASSPRFLQTQCFLRGSDLFAHSHWCSSAVACAAAHGRVHAKHFEKALVDARIDLAKRFEWKIGKIAPAFLGSLHRTTGNVVRFSKGHVGLAYQPVGKVGRRRETLSRSGLHSLRLELDGLD